MPLYEFYCEPCHTIFTFRSQRVDTVSVPLCPVCGQPLVREISVFAHSVKGKNRAERADDGEALNRMDQVMAQMGDRMHALEDDTADPREAVKVMRELASAGGMTFSKEVQEAMVRIEAGEDPEKIDEMFKEVFDTENPFEDPDRAPERKTPTWWHRLRGPRRDPNWYDLTQGQG